MCAAPPPVTEFGSVMLLTCFAGSSGIGAVAKRYDVNGRCSRNMYLGKPALTYGTVAITVLPNCGFSSPPFSSHSDRPSDAVCVDPSVEVTVTVPCAPPHVAEPRKESCGAARA